MSKRLLQLIPFAFAALLSFSSCMLEKMPDAPVVRPDVDYEGQQITVNFGVEMPGPQTKALGETPNITSLHVAVFGSSGYLKEYRRAEPVNGYVSAEGVANKKGYSVQLSITSSKVRVHFIANGPDTLPFDYESVVMSKLTSSGGQDAYWQRIILDHGIYADPEADGYYNTPPVLTLDPDFDLDTDGVTHKMALVPLIRNFAKITVVALPVAQSNFTIDSFCLVNVPDKGSVAPYNSISGDFMMDYQNYQTLNALSAVYPGNLPSESRIVKTYPSETDFTNRTNGVVAAGGAVYMYERPVPVSDATVLIVKGTYHESGNNYTGYYKIDLMDGGNYLPILRNFRYQINIQKVNRKGKSTVSGAINGAGSADISADISTASQAGISDGKSSISVSFTEDTLPIGGTYTLGVTFVPDVSTGVVNNSLVTYELQAPDKNGAVIAGADSISFNAATGILTFTTTAVDSVKMKSQKIRIIGQSSTSRLYRDVTIRLLPQQSMTVSCIPVIEAVPETSQTITVTIPKDLPQSIFPLQFKVEVANKTLTPNANDLPVEPGETIVPGESGSSFQFIKTVSYSDYTSAYSGNVSSFTCEFKSIIAESDSYVYVANKYFSTGSTHFNTYVKRYFYDMAFNTAGAINEDDPVQFTFKLDRDHNTGKLIPETVDVYLTGLIPDYDNPLFDSGVFQNVSGNHYVYSPEGGTGIHRLYLLSTGETPYYEVELKAEYYEDARLTNVPMEFTNLNFNSTVFYGLGWPTSFQFTIPNSYQMPAAGYIDIELNLTNLVPNDANITQSNGKYYYRATSKGTKTLNFKTAGSQTASVSVELLHGDFVPSTGTQSSRQYLNIAAGKITNSGPANNTYRTNRNTVNVYSDKSLTTQVASYTANTAGAYPYNSATNYSAANFASNVLDADDPLYFSMYSQYNNATYYAQTTAEALYNNGGNSTVTFGTERAGFFNNPNFSSTVLYGLGWPVSFQFTIPNAYTMPAGGIDIELNLTNLTPDDANIVERDGKYYYHTTSKGTKTLNFKTSESQTLGVGVELVHNDFETASVTQNTRSYLNIAAGKITNTAPENGAYRGNQNLVTIYTDENCTNAIATYNVNQTNSTNSNSQTNYNAADFSSNIVDASKLLYFKQHSNRTGNDYWATIKAENLYNNGGNSTVTFSKQPPTKKEVTITTSDAHYSTSVLSYTQDGVTLAFSNLAEVQGERLEMVNNSTVSISAPSGYHLESVQFNYYSAWLGITINYNPGSYSITNGGGTYNNGTWTSSNNTTTNATISMSGQDGILGIIGNRRVSMTSVVVIIEKN